MAKEEEVPVTELSGELTEGGSASIRGVKQFSECECDQPMVKPLSYVLPDQQFISLFYCDFCGGLCRYSVTELPTNDGDDDDTEEVEIVDALLEEVNELKTENERLQEKLHNQSRRMRIDQEPRLSGGEPAAIPADSSSRNRTGESETAGVPEGESADSTGDSHKPASKERLHPVLRKLLFAGIIAGACLTGVVMWNSSLFSALGIAAGTLLIIVPIYLLTNGELP